MMKVWRLSLPRTQQRLLFFENWRVSQAEWLRWLLLWSKRLRDTNCEAPRVLNLVKFCRRKITSWINLEKIVLKFGDMVANVWINTRALFLERWTSTSPSCLDVKTSRDYMGFDPKQYEFQMFGLPKSAVAASKPPLGWWLVRVIYLFIYLFIYPLYPLYIEDIFWIWGWS